MQRPAPRRGDAVIAFSPATALGGRRTDGRGHEALVLEARECLVNRREAHVASRPLEDRLADGDPVRLLPCPQNRHQDHLLELAEHTRLDMSDFVYNIGVTIPRKSRVTKRARIVLYYGSARNTQPQGPTAPSAAAASRSASSRGEDREWDSHPCT